ncbi:MAG: hypothetical protein ACRC41_12435 [Sarcina sp.]
MKYFKGLSTKNISLVSIGFALGIIFKILEINFIYGLIILYSLWLGVNLKDKGYLKLNTKFTLKYKDICK